MLKFIKNKPFILKYISKRTLVDNLDTHYSNIRDLNLFGDIPVIYSHSIINELKTTTKQENERED